MNQFLNILGQGFQLFHDEPLFMFSLCFLFVFLWWSWHWIQHRYDKTRHKDEVIVTMSNNITNAFSEYEKLQQKVAKFSHDADEFKKLAEKLQEDKKELIEALQILNARYQESEAMRQLLVDENYELRLIFNYLWSSLVPQQKLDINKYIKFDYKKYLD